MKHISILIPRGHFSIVNVEGSHQIFYWANKILEDMGREPMFNVQLVAIDKNTTLSTGLYSIHANACISEIQKTDVIIIPAIHGDFEENARANADASAWIQKQYKEGAEIASFCVGTFFLASTGLLHGKPCATHWRYANQFRSMFPEAKLLDDKIITDADGIYTSGGAYSFTNLMMYLVEKYAGRDVAIIVAKTFMIDIERNSQSPFIMFVGQKTHGDSEILQAQEFIEEQYRNKISVEEITRRIGIGRRTFERRFKKATSNTVVEYMQRVKVEAAKKQLESGRKTVSEVMFEVGYTDTKAFRDVFKKVTGLSPIDYRNKYYKELSLN